MTIKTFLQQCLIKINGIKAEITRQPNNLLEGSKSLIKKFGNIVVDFFIDILKQTIVQVLAQIIALWIFYYLINK
jgi:hypothetical protein